ncbi:hypothetical protein H257_19539 [Aphanomyces astaci]|uniref:Uncharacterized protein n=1 Tax=Aphanomyces astaci TaxID=112090 RepID=W4F9N2_APHAT|nr:hypothetical protein H257_19539 [Aphanomyces astaci]ETV63536.1 hypothetical protein H257_19539 [Aphanomyces astaci]|eukprot:XP_009846980.1 hypothetical protein H257_19539 [Aphanomyces astaci]
MVCLVVAGAITLNASTRIRYFLWGAAAVLCVADAFTYVVRVRSGHAFTEPWKVFMLGSTTPRAVYSALLAVAAITHGFVVAKLASAGQQPLYLMGCTSAMGAYDFAISRVPPSS